MYVRRNYRKLDRNLEEFLIATEIFLRKAISDIYLSRNIQQHEEPEVTT